LESFQFRFRPRRNLNRKQIAESGEWRHCYGGKETILFAHCGGRSVVIGLARAVTGMLAV
jgi:hypothetical protein